MIAAAVFTLWLLALVAGVHWLIRLDTNTPDTILSLRLRQMRLPVSRLETAVAEAVESVQAFSRAFARLAVTVRRAEDG